MRVVSLPSRRFRFAAPLGFLFLGLSTWLSAGCGGNTRTSICEAQCTCANNCNDMVTESCSTQFEVSYKLAASVGCNGAGEVDNYLTCESERATCAAGSFANNNCVAETQTFFSCLERVGCSYAFSENRVICRR